MNKPILKSSRASLNGASNDNDGTVVRRDFLSTATAGLLSFSTISLPTVACAADSEELVEVYFGTRRAVH